MTLSKRHFRGTKMGKMLRSVMACLLVFFYWAVIAVFVWIPYAFLQHNLRFPNRIVKSYEENFELNDETGEWMLTRTCTVIDHSTSSV